MKKILYPLVLSMTIVLMPMLARANSSVKVSIPTPNGGTTVQPSTIASTDSNFMGYIQLINKYLWIVLVIVALVALLYAGFTLFTQGAEKLKEVTRLLIGTLVGIFIAIFSYAIIRLLANLF